MLRIMFVLAALGAAILVMSPSGSAQGGQPMCPIDDSGQCVQPAPCDLNYPDPDACVTDDTGFDASVDQYSNYGGSGSCFDLHASRHGTWWRVTYDRHHVCVSNGRVTSFGSAQITCASSLYPPLSWYFSEDCSVYAGPTEPVVPTTYASSSMSFWSRFCSWVRCGSKVYGYITMDVTGWGGVNCYSDRGLIANCRGSR